jgi:PilZ domain-containing protein
MAAPRDTDERRSKRHVQADLVCEFCVGDAQHTGTVKDVSSGGLFIHTPVTVAPGTAITLVFAATADRPEEVRFSARVVRSDQIRPELQGVPGIGVEALQPGALEQVMGDLGRIERAGDALDVSNKRAGR